MATIAGILEGKTGNYFKLEDFGDDIFTIIESIDPQKTEIRTEKVKVKEGQKNANGKDETEYYHILCRCGEIEKDLSLTFTALKQLAGFLPRDANWYNYQLKFLGTKGTGKNIKYNFQVIGKITGEQARIGDEPKDVTTRVLKSLKQAPAGLQDAPFWEDVGKIVPVMSEAMALVERLKSEGRIVCQSGTWRAT